MKKKILQILGITLCMALIFPVHVQAANKKSSEAKVCYTKFIKKKKAAYDTEYGEYGAWEGNYKIVDINGDKIPELLVVGLNGKSYIYTYKTQKNKMKKLKSQELLQMDSLRPRLYYSAQKHKVVLMSANPSSMTFVTYKYKGKKIKKESTLVNVFGKNYRRGYVYNGKYISSKLGKKKVNKILKYKLGKKKKNIEV